ncbi:MAG: OmpA family protein [Candidatus Eisenbacteria bacterium]|nr:OmpA family protein [Candidatus Eisenbacteria bacterium]
MKRWLPVSIVIAAFLLLALGTPPAARGGFADKLKKKVEQTVGEKAEKEIDKKADEATQEKPEGEEASEETSSTPPAAGQGGSAAAEDMTLYTKYDFVPGDKVLFYDDLAKEELGEFPSRWSLEHGVFEIAGKQGHQWIMCSDKGTIRPRIPAGPLPERYTIEFDFYAKGGEARGHWYYIHWYDAENNEIGQFLFRDGQYTQLVIMNKDLADKDLLATVSSGIHTMRVMATRTTLKCYLDQERVANVPQMEGFAPVSFGIELDPWGEQDNPMLIGNLRYAEGGKTLRQQLDEEGKIVTHGILFDSGSDRIKAESYKTLALIGELLSGDAALKVSIEGHTDSDGADDANLALSQRRADAVRTYLADELKIDRARMETKGWGESKPIDVNTTPEGKANNRRVELVKR